MSLKDTILTYPVEAYVAFDEAYSVIPTNYGSIPYTGSTPWELRNTAPTYNSSVNPPGAIDGSWNFNQVAGSSGTRFNSDNFDWLTLGQSIHDGDYGHGIWVKINQMPQNNGFSVLHTVMRNWGFPGFNMWLRGAGHASGPAVTSNIAGGGSTGQVIINNPQLDTWYYIVHRKTNAPNSVEVFVNNQVVLLGDNQANDTSDIYDFTIGSSATVVTNASHNFDICHLHTMAHADFTNQAISDIYNAGISAGGTDIEITETPATASALAPTINNVSASANFVCQPLTASALSTEPTIIAVIGDNTYVTTSILVNANFPSNITIIASKNINNVVGTFEATADMEQHVVTAAVGVSFSAEPMEASATILEVEIPESPFIASATMPNASWYADANYFGQITNLNPFLYIGDGNPSPVNHGYSINQTILDNSLYKDSVDVPMIYINEGSYWVGTGVGINPYNAITIASDTYDNSFGKVVETGNWSVEFWTNFYDTDQATEIARIYGSGFRINRNSDETLTIYYRDDSGSQSVTTQQVPGLANLGYTDWHHVVWNSTRNNSSSVTHSIFINGALLISFTNTDSDSIPYNTGTDWQLVRFGINNGFKGGKLDEIALYDAPLTNSQIVNHYEYVVGRSPDVLVSPEPITAHSEIVQASFVATQNINIPAGAVWNHILYPYLVEPTIYTEISNSVAATPITANANIGSSINIYYGRTQYANAALATAEKAPSYFIDNTYSNYILNNITDLYRYVSFDGNNTLQDYGTDTKYSVPPVIIDGTVVSPGYGINGKSVETSGLDIYDGVVFYESEFNDTWGTGQNEYFSSFWMQRSLNDQSISGLRVLWNLHGEYNNQHVILYQYQNKLHMQFNNGSGQYIEESTPGNYDLFDYQRHLITIAFDHTGVNNYVLLYVDTQLAMVVDLEQYTGETVNSLTYLPPNDPASNYPRLAFGSLATNFVHTALSIVPANTKLIIDEPLFALSTIDLAGVQAMYNAMPPSTFVIVTADPLEISNSEFVNPEYSANVNYVALPMSASATIVEPSLFVVKENIYIVDEPMIANNAEIPYPTWSQPVFINADIMVANAIFNSAGVLITIPAPALTASATLPTEIYYNDILVTTAISPYMRYLRASSLQRAINFLREVK